MPGSLAHIYSVGNGFLLENLVISLLALLSPAQVGSLPVPQTYIKKSVSSIVLQMDSWHYKAAASKFLMSFAPRQSEVTLNEVHWVVIM